MAVITTVCQGATWQDDFTTIVPNLTRYFRRVFNGWRDGEELAHEATLNFMESFARKWSPGTTLKLTTNFAVLNVKKGCRFVRRFCGGRHGRRSVKSKTGRMDQLARVKAKLEKMLHWLDFKILLERLSEQDATVVRMAYEGHSMHAIKKMCHMDNRRIRRILTNALTLL